MRDGAQRPSPRLQVGVLRRCLRAAAEQLPPVGKTCRAVARRRRRSTDRASRHFSSRPLGRAARRDLDLGDHALAGVELDRLVAGSM
jgi:hypothetical protein